jgi:DNA polymerase III subunit epsilon
MRIGVFYPIQEEKMPAQIGIVNRCIQADIPPMNAVPQWLSNQTFVAFDTETTGMWAPVHRMVEIGGVRFSIADGILGSFSELIHPQRAMPPEVIPIHGITDDMIAGAETADNVLRRFGDFCGDAILIAHNAPFDLSFVVSELERFGMPLWQNPVLDTVDISRRAFPGQNSYSLLSLAKSLKLAESQLHRAQADADLVRQLFLSALPYFQKVESLESMRTMADVISFDELRPQPVVLSPEQKLLGDAITSGGRIEIRYARPDAAVTVRIIRPRWLHSRRSTTYLTAFCELAKDERTFRLDRILEMRRV